MELFNSPLTNDCFEFDVKQKEKVVHLKPVTIDNVGEHIALLRQLLDKVSKMGINKVLVRFKNRGIEKKEEIVDETTGEKVMMVIYRNVCVVPKGLQCYEEEVHENMDRTFSCNLDKFVQFYEVNLKNLVTENMISFSDLNNKPDDDGFIQVIDKRKIKKENREKLYNGINVLRHQHVKQ